MNMPEEAVRMLIEVVRVPIEVVRVPIDIASVVEAARECRGHVSM